MRTTRSISARTKPGQSSEEQLARALDARGIQYERIEGEAAFYGPKIDIKIEDAIGRIWQLGTIQVDWNLPERFQLEYTGEDGQKHRPVMIHRALFGSIERFFGVLIEHYAGAFPLWLAPVQVIGAADHGPDKRICCSRSRRSYERPGSGSRRILEIRQDRCENSGRSAAKDSVHGGPWRQGTRGAKGRGSRT